MLARYRLLTQIQTVTILLIAFVGIITVTLASPASAHEGRNVGDYNLVVGFVREPAYEGQLNAISLVVTRTAHGEPASESDNAPEMSAEADDHDHDSHSHSHGDDHADAESGVAAAVTDTEDIMTHGAVFISPGIGRGESFELEITEEFRGYRHSIPRSSRRLSRRHYCL